MKVFSPGARILELGGGSTPRYHPNADVRWLPQVDIPGVDFNYPLPIPSGQYDSVYASYILEHLSWRKVRGFIGECYRILRPGGLAVFITANLLEQCRALVATPEWNDALICMLFGDQNYDGGQWDANAHHCGFSPESISKVLKDVGFHQGIVYPHPHTVTDMVVEGTKSGAIIT